MGNRSRIWILGETEVGQAETIAIGYNVLVNSEILQISGRFGQAAAPTTPGDFYVQRENVAGPQLYVAFVRFDPSANGNIELVCAGHGWQLRKGDILRIIYPNPDDLTCGVEIILKEGE